MIVSKGAFALKLVRADELSKVRLNLTRKIDVNGLKRPNTNDQREFAKIIVSANVNEFFEYFDAFQKEDCEIQVQFPDTHEKLTENEYSGPPLEVEQQFYTLLKHVPPRMAASATFWTSYQVEMIRRGIIQPSFLAKKTQESQSGRARMEKALRRDDADSIDKVVRTVLRRLGGLYEARGSLSIYEDCRLARAWWRGFIAVQVSEDSGHDPNLVWKLLHQSSAPYETMMLYQLRKLTIISERGLRSAFLSYLLEMKIGEKSKERKELVERILRRIGELSAYQELGFLSYEENKKLIKENLIKISA